MIEPGSKLESIVALLTSIVEATGRHAKTDADADLAVVRDKIAALVASAKCAKILECPEDVIQNLLERYDQTSIRLRRQIFADLLWTLQCKIADCEAVLRLAWHFLKEIEPLLPSGDGRNHLPWVIKNIEKVVVFPKPAAEK